MLSDMTTNKGPSDSWTVEDGPPAPAQMEYDMHAAQHYSGWLSSLTCQLVKWMAYAAIGAIIITLTVCVVKSAKAFINRELIELESK